MTDNEGYLQRLRKAETLLLLALKSAHLKDRWDGPPDKEWLTMDAQEKVRAAISLLEQDRWEWYPGMDALGRVRAAIFLLELEPAIHIQEGI